MATFIVSSVSGSGPSYTVTYTTSPTVALVGDSVIVEKREAGAGTGSTILSTYTYIVTAINLGANQLTIQYSSDTAGLGDDSPADLYSGGGSSGSPEIAPHNIFIRNRVSSLFVEVLGDETAPGRNSVSSLFVEVLGDETAPGRNSVSSLFVEVLGDDTGDAQSISTNFGGVELKAVYFGDVQINKIRHGNISIYN